jgi:hypothetical protein
MVKQSTVIVLEIRLLKSAVWISLSGTAKAVYLLFRTKCRMGRPPGKPGKRSWTILNNGELVFTYREAARKYGITASRFRRALDELIEKGFIDVEATGMGVHRVTTQYAVSDHWRDYGTPAFCQASRPEPSIRNPGFKPGNMLWRIGAKKKSSVESEHGAVRENEHGEAVTVCESAHGERDAVSRKCRNRKQLSCEIAQNTTVRENDTVL